MATPSLALFPSGRKATKLYSVLPTNGTGDFTVARAGLRNEINSDLKLSLIAANVPAFNYDAIGGCPVLNTEPQATNLVTYPISFGNSYWTKSGAMIQGDDSTLGSELVTDPTFSLSGTQAQNTVGTYYSTGTDWAIAGGIATSSATAASFAKLTVVGSTLTIGKLYKIVYTVSAYTSNTIIFTDGVSLGTARNSAGTFTEYFYATGTEITLRSYGQFNGSVSDFSVKEIQGYSAPSVDFPTSAFKLVESATTGAHWIRSLFGFTAGSYTQTIYAKQAERSVLQIFLGGQHSGTAYANFDLSNGTIPNSAVLQANIKALADGWYECSVTFTAVTTAGEAIYYAVSNSTSLARAGSYTGDGTSGVYLFMAQVETGSAATSPTFTDITLASEGSTTTRLADVVTGAGDATLFSSVNSSGVLYWKGSVEEITAQRILSLSKDSSNNFYIYLNVLDQLIVDYISGGSIIYTSGVLAIDFSITNKIAFRYSDSNFSVWVNGVKVDEQLSGTIVPIVYNELLFGFTGSSSYNFNGNTKSVQVLTYQTDAELIALTTL